jgi:uncharacterized protein
VIAFRRVVVLAVAVLAGGWLAGAERIPPAPPAYFNDYAGVVSRPVAAQLNAQLEQFERTTSNQLLVAIYPKMESDSSVEDYTVRVAEAWRVGQARRNNGAVLFAFMQEHQLYIQVGYGLEPVLPDALAKRIIEREIVPRFRAGDVDGGMVAAVQAMMAAAKGEYKGTGRTQADQRGGAAGIPVWVFIVGFILLGILNSLFRRSLRRPSVFLNPGRRGVRPAVWWTGGGGGGWSGGGGGGGGFSGGGGSFGGGGAGGKW